MSEIINLRQARKQAARKDKEAEAAANRAKHGQSKAERSQTVADVAKTRKALDQAKRDDS